MDGWNRGDVDAWLRAAHQEVEFSSEILKRVEGDETVLRGTAELRRFWDEWHSVWNLTIDVSEIRDLGDTVVALGRIRTRGKASGIDLEGPLPTCSSSTEAWPGRCVPTWTRGRPSKP